MKSHTDIEKIREEWDIKFNEVLNRMYHLEIVPEIQSKINERIPEGGFNLFKSEELFFWIESKLKKEREEVIKTLTKPCLPANCPFADGAIWGMSPEGLAYMKEIHDKLHSQTK